MTNANTGAASAHPARPWQRQATRLRLQAEILAWRRGWTWPLALVLLLASAGIWQGVLVPQQSVEAALRSDLHRLRHTPSPSVAPESPTGTRVATDDDAASELRAVLEPRAEIGRQLQRLFALAAAERLVTPRSDYQRAAAAADGIERLQVNLAFKATYPQLRRFMENTLREMNSVSIDQLSFKRSQVSQAEVEVKVRLSLWLAAPPSAAAAAVSRPDPSVSQTR
ncbi:hypothetical protein [Rhizobacter sp. Root1221]|uniref:hypothetical protein n=1 Tax=Rhizobacter sp. Root1221 TaxID=1736433 RepID=UPI0006FEDFD4|nr:hypothetical protein [Rhizobacter sp. Root1221]KQV94752.1 hypothetical protein ASC87_25925 [Rhizobacter sp. Root1221]